MIIHKEPAQTNEVICQSLEKLIQENGLERIEQALDMMLVLYNLK